MTPTLLLIALAGCVPQLVPPDLPDNPGADFDGDGFTEEDGDCDDLATGVNPNAAERCDDLDNDCDGEIDGSTAIDRGTWYPDIDEDGYGSSDDAVRSCVAPEGFVTDASDCDDADATLNPESIWYEDADADGFGSIDRFFVQCHPPNDFVANAEDCNDADAAAYPGATWYLDADGDGYGDPALGLDVCMAPPSYVTNGDDCNDANSLQNPDTLWYDDTDNDGYGDESITLVSCDIVDDHVLVGGDCDVSSGTVFPGAPEICVDGIDQDCDGEDPYCLIDGDLDALAWATYTAEGAGDWTGSATTVLDAGRFAISAEHVGAAAGRVYVLQNPAAPGDYAVADEAQFSLEGFSFSQYSGRSVQPMHVAGVLDAIAVGAPGVDDSGDDHGAVYVWNNLAASDQNALTDSSAILTGEELGWAGEAIAVGDDDNDGLPDLMIGSPQLNADDGGLYLTHAPYDADRDLADEPVRMVGAAAQGLGSAVAAGFDANGDGTDDVLVGSAKGSNAVLLLGPVTGTDLAASTHTSLSGGTDSGAGSAVLAMDLDGDDQTDLIVGAPHADLPGEAGRVYVVYGPFPTSSSIDLATAASATFMGEVDAQAGHAVSNGGDIDLDGVDDLLIGAPLHGGTGTQTGAGWAIAGGAYTGVNAIDDVGPGFMGLADGDKTGWSIGAAPNVEGSNADIFVGSRDAGTVTLILGGVIQ